MKFHSIEIDAFGALSGTVFDGLNDGLSVIYGPNGTGKTTLLHFLRGLFCGYAGARKLGLLPASGGDPGGGSVELDWQGDVRRFGRTTVQRTTNPEVDNTLRITSVRDGRQATNSNVASDHLPTAQIPLLYTVGHAEVHAVDKLVRMALADGIDLVTHKLVTRREDSDRSNVAASNLHSQPSEPIDSNRDRIAELREQRRQIRAERQQLKSELEERCRLVTEERGTRKAEERLHWRQRVDWLHAELQAAECDLRESEELAWRRDRRQRLVPRKSAPLLRLRRVPSTSHVEVSHRDEFEDIDRRVAEARLQLETIANARLEVNLRAARIAGTPELPTDELLSKLRASLSAMEDALLELQEDAEQFNTSPARHQSDCGEWCSTASKAVEDARRRLYGTCESVSQFELEHLRTQLEAETARLNDEEQTLLRRLQSLEEQRRQLIARTGHLDRKSTRLNSSHTDITRMPSSA